MKEQMIATYNQLNEDSDNERETIGREIAEVTKKLGQIEERYYGKRGAAFSQ